MNIGGMQITDGATYAPTRTDEPPGTMRTRSAVENCRAGKVSLSTKVSGVQPVSVSSPKRNPSRMPCFTHALTIQWASPSSFGIFSAARILPWVSASRNSRNTGRASGLRSTSPSAARRSMEDFSDDMREKYKANEESRSCVSLNALALTADEYAGHAVCGLAALDQ